MPDYPMQAGLLNANSAKDSFGINKKEYDRMEITLLQAAGTGIFALALLHTFATKFFDVLARRHPAHAGLFHLLGEVEVVFGFWAFVLIVAIALISSGAQATAYVESRQYAEPFFVFVVMVIAASRPVLETARILFAALARNMPVATPVALAWLGLTAAPLLGSLITEPAAMTLAALMLAPQIFRQEVPEWLKYGALGVLFVNVSIGGTLTSYAAPPILMVATTWNWNSAYMAVTFGWRAMLAVLINATAITFLLRTRLVDAQPATAGDSAQPFSWVVSAIHLGFLAGVVIFAHHPVLFLGLFLFFLGYTHAYERYQNPLMIKEALLVGFFLAGLVVLGGMQRWWLQPVVSAFQPVTLFFGALGLTAVTDNAALTYLGSLIDGISGQAKYMLVAGAVAGGGLTVIANAPNPAGAALLRRGFNDESIGAIGLLLGALPPTAVAAACFLM